MSVSENRSRLAVLLTTGTLERRPWAHSYIDKALPRDLVADLDREFGCFPLQLTGRVTGKKTYRFAHTAVRDVASEWKSPAWQLLGEVVTGAVYRQNLQRLTGVDLEGAEVGLDLWEYRDNDWLAPHVDKEDKIVTQIVYLTSRWHDGDGGRLLILNSDDVGDLHRALPPTAGSSAVLVRSKSSWHSRRNELIYSIRGVMV